MFMVNLNHDCFDHCVHNFSASNLSTAETSCLKNCGVKGIKQQGMMSEIMNNVNSKYGDRF